MTARDPAIEAVKRALGADTGGAYVGIAREALAPIRVELESLQSGADACPNADWALGVEEALDAIRPLVYRED